MMCVYVCVDVVCVSVSKHKALESILSFHLPMKDYLLPPQASSPKEFSGFPLSPRQYQKWFGMFKVSLSVLEVAVHEGKNFAEISTHM